MVPIRWCIQSGLYLRIFTLDGRIRYKIVCTPCSRQASTYRHSLETTMKGRQDERQGGLRGIGSFSGFGGLRKSYVENTRGVIFETETCSLVCADIKETFLSRKNNMHLARCLLCARVSLICIFRITFSHIITNMCRLFLQKKIRAPFKRWCTPRTIFPISRLLSASFHLIDATLQAKWVAIVTLLYSFLCILVFSRHKRQILLEVDIARRKNADALFSWHVPRKFCRPY